MNSVPSLPLSIDNSSPIPIHIQLREQLKCLIGFEAIRTGDFLPPANELARQLNLNRNTVIFVYNQLSRDGYVRIRKGTGTQVVSSSRTIEDRAMLERIQSKLPEAGREPAKCKELPVELLAFLQIRSHLTAQPDEAKRVLFVEYRPNDYQTYKSEIERINPAEISLISLQRLDELSDRELTESLKPFDMVVIPYAGLNDINRLAPMSEKKIVAVGDIPY